MRKEFIMRKENGQSISAVAYVPQDEDVKHPTVIFSHGFGSNYRELQHHGEGFADQGIVCVFFDFCGGGMASLSDGKMDEMTLLTEIEDLETVIENVITLPYVDENLLFLQGESMGGFVSAYVAAKYKQQIRALVLWYPAFVILDDSRKRFEANEDTCMGMKLNPEFNVIAMDIDIYSIIGDYDGPVLIIHGDKDPIVPLAYSDKANTTYANSELIVLAGAGHGFDGEDSNTARKKSVEFVRRFL